MSPLQIVEVGLPAKQAEAEQSELSKDENFIYDLNNSQSLVLVIMLCRKTSIRRKWS